MALHLQCAVLVEMVGVVVYRGSVNAVAVGLFARYGTARLRKGREDGHMTHRCFNLAHFCQRQTFTIRHGSYRTFGAPEANNRFAELFDFLLRSRSSIGLFRVGWRKNCSAAFRRYSARLAASGWGRQVHVVEGWAA